VRAESIRKLRAACVVHAPSCGARKYDSSG
jgi:hypothetical protein